MRSGRLLGAFAGVVISLCLGGTAAAAMSPPRIVAGDVPATGSISGVITDASTGQPLAGVCGIVVRASFADAVGGVPDAYYTQRLAPAYVVRDFSGCLDENGGYTITDLPPDVYNLQVADVSHRYDDPYDATGATGDPGDVFSSGTVVSAGETTQADLVVEPAGAITGTVRDASTGEPLADDCGVQITANYGEHGAGQGYHPDGCTDGDGRYSITGLVPGHYSVSFFQPGYLGQVYDKVQVFSAFVPPPTVVTVGAGQTASGIDADLEHGGTLKITCLSAKTGKPVTGRPGLNVSVYANHLVDGQVTSYGVKYGRLSSSGVLTLSNFQPGTYRLTGGRAVWYGGRSWRTATPVTITDDQTTNLTMRLPRSAFFWQSTGGARPATVPARSARRSPTVKSDPAASGAQRTARGRLAGSVTDSVTGQPLAHDCKITITVYRRVIHPESSTDVADRVRRVHRCLDAAGRFRISGLVASHPTRRAGRQPRYTVEVQEGSGNYSLGFFGGSRSIYHASYVTVPAHRTRRGTHIALMPLATATGTVYDAYTGQPIPDLCGLTANLGTTTGCTDDQGEYVVTGIEPRTAGGFVVGVGPTDGYFAHSYNSGRPVEIAPDAHMTGIDIPLVPTGTLQVTVDDANGQPMSNTCQVSVEVWAVDDAEAPRAIAAGCTDADGALSVEWPAAGDAKVDVRLQDSFGARQWAGGSSFADATAYHVQPGQTTAVAVTTNG